MNLHKMAEEETDSVTEASSEEDAQKTNEEILAEHIARLQQNP